jgi:phosphotransacetylase
VEGEGVLYLRASGNRVEEARLDPRAVVERYVAPLTKLRRHKGWTEEVAREHLADPITVGTMMLRQGEVDGLVCGAAHTTAANVPGCAQPPRAEQVAVSDSTCPSMAARDRIEPLG